MIEKFKLRENIRYANPPKSNNINDKYTVSKDVIKDKKRLSDKIKDNNKIKDKISRLLEYRE